MYFPALNALYLHPGKTAGSSIELTLMPGDRDPGVANRKIMFGWDQDEGIYLQHAAAYSAKLILGVEKFDAAFRFMTVRNPFTRIHSIYRYNIDFNLRLYGDFRKFVLQLPELVRQPKAARGEHLTPQYLFATIEGRSVCDAVLRFEHLAEDFARLTGTLNGSWTLVHSNRFQHSGQSLEKVGSLYDEEMVTALRTAYADDFQFFGYPDSPCSHSSQLYSS